MKNGCTPAGLCGGFGRSGRGRLGGRLSACGRIGSSDSIAQFPQNSVWHTSQKSSQFRLAERRQPRIRRLFGRRCKVPFAFPLNLFAGGVPFLLVTIQHIALPDHGLQQLGQGIGETALAVIAKDVRVLVKEDGEGLGKVGDEGLLGEERLARAVSASRS
jgi:hypothetical protein